jgi:peptidoglycan/LPS O-acetylase OafA/YrhL
MNPYSLLFPLVIFFTAYFTAHLLTKVLGAPTEMDRQSTLDGLRGILALAVFICHTTAWHHYFNTGSFVPPDIGIFRQFAKSSVYMFFMITGFLFMSKLLNDRDKDIDWIKLFVSRVLRIAPLYLTVVCIMVFLVLVESNFRIQVTWSELLIDIFRWLTFTVFGEPLLNNYDKTLLITSHVQWTLVYEWLFYLSLPLLAVILKIRVPFVFIAASITLVLLFIFNMRNLFFPAAFLAGILTAIIFRFGQIKLLLTHPAFSIIAIALVLWQGWNYPEISYQQPSKVPAFCLSVAFVIIACGNNLFGILTTRTARYLGEVSFGVYLLHGIVMFTVFNYIFGFEHVSTMSAVHYWLLISFITVLLIVAATLTYRLIEAPAMRRVSKVSLKIKNTFGLQSAGQIVKEN